METLLHTDQLGRQVVIPFPPRRIVSLVPSQTELLYHLGLNSEVVGITKFCRHPEQWFREKTRIGGTKQLHLDAIKALRPDLVIANKEENERWQVNELMESCPVWVSNIHNLQEALEMIRGVGAITGKAEAAEEIAGTITQRFSSLAVWEGAAPLRTAYFIWKDPWMVAGGDTFIHTMLETCGLSNVFGGMSRYPEITIEQLQAADCQLVLLSSEPYPFAEKHAAMLREQLPGTQIMLVDGEMFSWYGSRLLEAPGYFSRFMEEVKLKNYE
ncbi:helical backbone metal receptor [Chitinophaga tropicalis]|uniref:ABC transporter substrate-binding protein n=1 Tax=Chitinophaga tropicalis TaxID=2683588 RepID=A0A7K1U186_9BACT|nr:helical backbone metal receptor [Chitinophaga tropicalis]MVT08060.1 ABC transporter substrate-binding protein [Chitinophaga tropicalis]